MKTLNLITILLVTFFIHTSLTQVIGIDFGTQFWKAALISPGKNFVVVQNSRSERKTPNGVSFVDGVRLFESQGISKKGRYPKSTFTDLNQLLRVLDNPELKIETGNNYKYQNGTINFQYESDKNIKLQQLLGMIFKNIKTHASKQAGTEIKDCVITIPSDWGLAARSAIVNAAYIGDLSVLSLINQNTAAALNYAMTRNDQQSINVMMFNLGSYSLQISIIRFFGLHDKQKNKTIQSLEVLAHQTIHQISGYAVDQIIANIIAKYFNQKYKKNVEKNLRAWTKVLQKASDVKQTLSANKQANVYIQSLLDGIDFNMIITRAQVQQSPIYDVITKSIQKVLDKADISKYAITSVQLIGGASRIPKVISKVTEYFKSAQVGTHINGDEAMALGSVLHAANMSVTFRVKDIHLYDGFNFPININITTIGQQSRVLYSKQLFSKKDPFWTKKQIQLNHTEQDILISLSSQNEILRQFTTQNLSNWKNVHDSENLTKPVVLKLHFVVSSIAIVQLKQIYLNIYKNESSIKQVVQYVKQRIIYNTTKNQTNQQIQATSQNTQNSTKTEQQNINNNQQSNKQKNNNSQDSAQQKNQQQKQSTTDNSTNTEQRQSTIIDNSTTTQQQTNNNQTSADAKNKTQKKKKLPKYKTVTVKKNVTQYKQKLIKYNIKTQNPVNKYKRLSKSQITDLSKIIRKFQKFQNSLKQKSKAKNQLQSRLYDLRRSYDQKYMTAFSTSSEFQNLKKVVQEQLLWLEDNSFSGTKQDFELHLQNVFQAYKPIYNRTVQYQNRGKTVNQTIQYLGQVYQKAVELNNSNPWVRQKAEGLMLKVNQTFDWYKSKLEQQQKMPLNQDPVFYNYEPIRRAEKLRDQYYLIKMIPRPKSSGFPNTLSKEDVQQMVRQQKNKQQADKKKFEDIEQLLKKKEKEQREKQNKASDNSQGQQTEQKRQETETDL